tara:strand:- start:194 stop:637 length:444 start_codon:yes stop_codon:yes gene_type:complete
MIITEKGLIKINSYNEIVNLDEYQKFNCVLFTKSFFLENITKISSQKKNGLLLNSDDKIEDISQHIIIFSLINVRFLNFKDGRPFSIARDLREIFSYKNEIRASGQILPDQLIFLLKCGFNSVEIDKTKKDTWLNIFKTDSRQDYQR